MKAIKDKPVSSFIIITLLLSLATCFLPVEGEMAFAVIALVLVMIPTLVAIGLEMLTGGRRDAITFLRECFRWRGAAQWYIIAIGIGLLMNFTVSVLALFLGYIPAITISAPIVFRLLIVPHAALLEEIGWRGFVLPRLLQTHSPLRASLIIGIPWSLIHVLLVFLYVPGRSGIWDGLAILPISFALSWVFIRSDHKVLVSTVLHISLNIFTFVAPMIPQGEWLAVVSYTLVAAVIMLVDRHIWFASPSRPVKQEPLPSAVS